MEITSYAIVFIGFYMFTADLILIVPNTAEYPIRV